MVVTSACVVDAFSTGALYAAALRKRGVAAVHVQSRDPIPKSFAQSFAPGDFAANVIYSGDLARCVAEVARFEPSCVIAGCEMGVRLADRLAEALGVPTNGSALSGSRRNKYEMQMQVQRAGLRGIPTLSTRDWREAEAWIQNLGRWPIVLKPPESAGTEGVTTCTTLAEAKAAFESIVDSTTHHNEKSHTVILQPFVFGDEYIVNTVSAHGRHTLLSIWKVEKVRGKHTLYDHVMLQPSSGERIAEMRDYTFGVLDALGIRHGAGHTELFWTPDGPCLIETGARLGGQKGTQLVERATGRSAVEAVLDAYLEPEQLLARYGTPYALGLHACRVELISPATGTLVALPHLAEVRALRSFDGMAMTAQLGERIVQTTDFTTIPGFVDLLHADPAVIAEDLARIRKLEATGFYQIAV